MPRYEFECATCGEHQELVWPIADYANLPWPRHCGEKMNKPPQLFGMKFGRTPGRESGFYTLDYGKRVTEDLTVPGKFARLHREGILKDPFAGQPDPPMDPKTAEATFGDPTPAEIEAARK